MTIVESILNIYDSFKSKDSNHDTYTVLATIYDMNDEQILAIASGTQACSRVYQDDLQDCHAESLVKRAYRRYLINSLLLTLKSGCTLAQFDQIVALESERRLALFITQFPCGLIKRYEGEEPVDKLTGNVIKRKPGRGVVIDGQTVYVEKDSCLEKIQKWHQVGLQGKHLAHILRIKSGLKKVIIGRCEPDEEFIYEKYAQELRSLLPSVEVEIADGARRDEFLYRPGKRPKSVALVAVKLSCDNYYCEYVVDGRKRGMAKKHHGNTLIRAHLLSIGNHRLREDLKLLEELYAELKHRQEK